MKAKSTLLNVTTITLVCIAVVTLSHRIVSWWSADESEPLQSMIPGNWQTYSQVGHRLGPDSAPLTIVQFFDFQCPFCRDAHENLIALRRAFPTELVVVYRHLPIGGTHQHALDGAFAAECASEEDRFESFADAVFRQQEMIGLRPWADFGRDAGLSDIAGFEDCILNRGGWQAVQQDIQAAQALGAKGTPTFLVNDVLVHGNLELNALTTLVEEVLARR